MTDTPNVWPFNVERGDVTPQKRAAFALLRLPVDVVGACRMHESEDAARLGATASKRITALVEHLRLREAVGRNELDARIAETAAPRDGFTHGWTAALVTVLREGTAAERELARRLAQKRRIGWKAWTPEGERGKGALPIILREWLDAIAAGTAPTWVGAWSQPIASFVSSTLRRDNVVSRRGQLDLLLDRDGKPIAEIDSGRPGIPPILLAEAHENPAVLGSIEAHVFIRWACAFVAEHMIERDDGTGGWMPFIDLRGHEGELAALLGLRDREAPGRLRELLDALGELQGQYPAKHPKSVRFRLLEVRRDRRRTTVAFGLCWTPRFQKEIAALFPNDPMAYAYVPALGLPPLHSRRDVWALDASAALEAGIYFREHAEEYAAHGSVEVPRIAAERWAHHAGFAQRYLGRTADRLLDDWTRPGGKRDPDAPALLEHVEGRRFRLGPAYAEEESFLIEGARRSQRARARARKRARKT